jgi:hypothetical protein
MKEWLKCLFFYSSHPCVEVKLALNGQFSQVTALVRHLRVGAGRHAYRHSTLSFELQEFQKEQKLLSRKRTESLRFALSI